MPVHFCRLHNRVRAAPAVKTLNSDDQEKHSLRDGQTLSTSHVWLGFFFTYSLLVRDVQLWFGVRLQLVLIKAGVDPSILHDLLQNSQECELRATSG